MKSSLSLRHKLLGLIILAGMGWTLLGDNGAEGNPTGDPIGGGVGYSDIIDSGTADYVVTTASGFLDLFDPDTSPTPVSGDIVYVSDSVELDLSGNWNIQIPGGITLASGRGSSSGGVVSQGALLYTTDDNPTLYASLLEIGGANVRITGIRIKGPDPEVGDHDYTIYELVRGIQSEYSGIEVDNCELYGWNYSAVELIIHCLTANIHHNYIHHCRRVGAGYGVTVIGYTSYPLNALIEANLFDFCRHVINGHMYEGTSYEARYNIVLEHGLSHAFDRHGDSSEAGDTTYVHHNTVQNIHEYGVAIRGLPCVEAEICNNWFYHPDESSAIYLYTTQDVSVHDNSYGLTPPTGTTLPLSAISANVSSGTVPLSVSFTASDPNSEIVSYNWDFGDDGTAIGSQASHTFTSVGRYLVTLSVSDDKGVVSRYRTPITASPSSGGTTLSLWLKDSYRGSLTGKYRLQVLIDDQEVWGEDAAGDEGWQHVVVDVSEYLAGKIIADVSVRVKCLSSCWDPSQSIEDIIEIEVYCDDLSFFGANINNGDFETGSDWQFAQNGGSWFGRYRSAEARSGKQSYSIAHIYEATTIANTWGQISQTIVFNDLAGSWRMNESSGSSEAFDCSGFANDGSLINMDTQNCWVDGVFGGALELDGLNDYVNFSNDSSLQLTSHGTIEFWYKSNGWRDEYTSLIGYGDSASWPTHASETWNVFNHYANNYLAFAVGNGSTYNYVNISPRPSINVWHHYAFTFDGSKLCAYLDGELWYWRPQTIILNQATLNTYIGKYTPDGIMDEVNIYQRKLSDSEIKTKFLQKGLVLHAGFDEASGTTATDSGSYGNDGSLENVTAPDCWTNGRLNNALELDGANDYVDFGDAPSQMMQSEGTISFWYKSNGWRSEYTSLIGCGVSATWPNYPTEAWNVFNHHTGNYLAFAVGDGSSYNHVRISPRPSTDVWHYYAFSFDGNEIRAYLDGELQDSTAQTVTMNSATLDTCVGKYRTPDGIIDELKLYSHCLPAKDIKSEYQNSYLVTYLNMDENDSSVAHDKSGFDNHGFLINMEPTSCWEDGKIGNGLELDGDDDCVVLQQSSQLTSSGTVAFWYKSNGWRDAYASLIGSGDCNTWPQTADEAWNIFNHYSAGYLAFSVGNGSGQYNSVMISPRPSTGDWHHYVFTFNGSNLYAYLDGELKSSSSQTISINTAELTTFIGNYQTPDGIIDEVMLFNHALDVAEIGEIYGKGTNLLMAHYPLNENSGSVANDISGNNYHGALNFISPGWTDGKAKGGLEFDVSTDHVDFGNALELTDEGTIAFWYKSDGWSSTSYTTLLCRGNGITWANSADEAWNIFNHYSAGYLAFTVGNGSGQYNSVTISPRPSTGDWHHYAFTYDGSTLTAYLDGEYVSSTSQTVTINSATLNTYSGKRYSLNGTIDEIKIYSDALSADDITTVYNQAFLVGQYKLDETTGAIANDSSEYHNDGVLHNLDFSSCWQEGLINNGLAFDGQTSSVKVDLGEGDSLKLIDEGTIEFWFNADNWSNAHTTFVSRGTVAGFPTASSHAWVVYHNYGLEEIVFAVGDGSGSYDWVSVARPDSGEWHHYAFTFDGSNIKVYLDGSLADYDTQSVTINTASLGTYLGYSTSNSVCIDGIMDQVQLWSRSLSQTEIQEHYQEGL